jgi:hypothetical protein
MVSFALADGDFRPALAPSTAGRRRKQAPERVVADWPIGSRVFGGAAEDGVRLVSWAGEYGPGAQRDRLARAIVELAYAPAALRPRRRED